jgi:hypothetical protein
MQFESARAAQAHCAAWDIRARNSVAAVKKAALHSTSIMALCRGNPLSNESFRKIVMGSGIELGLFDLLRRGATERRAA